MATKICVICGAGFYAPPSSKKITCSKECSSKRKSQSHTGIRFKISEEAYRKLVQRPIPEGLKLGTAASLKSPISGPFETNRNAKIWHVVSPEGETFVVRNLSKWCRDNAELFAPDSWQSARAGFRTLNRGIQGKTPRTVSQWKGWTLEKPSENP